MKVAFYQCTVEGCRLRYPGLGTPGYRQEQLCPKCGGVAKKRGASLAGDCSWAQTKFHSSLHISVLLDNLRSAYNVGAIFRTADAAGVRHLYLTGISPTPANSRVSKTALGAENHVAWSQANNGPDVARRLKEDGQQLWALEATASSTALPDAEAITRSILLVVGNEVAGLDPALLEMADRIVHIPMYGHKRSLNVEVALGVAAFHVRLLLERQRLAVLAERHEKPGR